MYDNTLARWPNPDPLAEKYYSVSPYAYTLNNPVMYIDPDGRWVESVWDAANIAIGAASFWSNAKQGNVGGAAVDGLGIVYDVVATVVPMLPGFAGTLIKSVRAGDKAVDAIDAAMDVSNAVDNAADAAKASNITENAAKGKAFEKQVGESLGNNKASQVTIEAADGTRTRVDFVQKTDGKVTITEAKGSQTAPLTRNQSTAFPQIEATGGTIRGNKGVEIGLPAGEMLPPTKIEVIRPEDLLKNQ